MVDRIDYGVSQCNVTQKSKPPQDKRNAGLLSFPRPDGNMTHDIKTKDKRNKIKPFLSIEYHNAK